MLPARLRHEVRNHSATEDALFLLVHAPSEGYDFPSSSAEPSDQLKRNRGARRFSRAA